MPKRRNKRPPTHAQTARMVEELTVVGVVVYQDLVSIAARKQKGARTVYEHPYSHRGVNVVGLPDGSILIPQPGQPLWGRV